MLNIIDIKDRIDDSYKIKQGTVVLLAPETGDLPTEGDIVTFDDHAWDVLKVETIKTVSGPLVHSLLVEHTCPVCE